MVKNINFWKLNLSPRRIKCPIYFFFISVAAQHNGGTIPWYHRRFCWENKCGNGRYPPGPNMSSSGIFRGKLIFFLNKKCLITKMRPGFFHKLPEPGEYDRVASAWYLGSLAGAEQKRRDEMFTGHWSDCCPARRIITSQRRKILLTRNIAHQISRAGWKEEKYIGISKKIS